MLNPGNVRHTDVPGRQGSIISKADGTRHRRRNVGFQLCCCCCCSTQRAWSQLCPPRRLVLNNSPEPEAQEPLADSVQHNSHDLRTPNSTRPLPVYRIAMDGCVAVSRPPWVPCSRVTTTRKCTRMYSIHAADPDSRARTTGQRTHRPLRFSYGHWLRYPGGPEAHKARGVHANKSVTPLTVTSSQRRTVRTNLYVLRWSSRTARAGGL